MTKEQVVIWIKLLAEEFERKQDFLTELDREIGDADHGLNMNRGFKKVIEKLPTANISDIGAIFQFTGMTLLSSVGGASGVLYGTFFIKAAPIAKGKEEISFDELVDMLEKGVAGVIERGKANVGDKTMIDLWKPVLDSLISNKEQEQDIAMEQAEKVAKDALKATIPLIAKKGRASYLGERSIGHQDPGATSSCIIFSLLHEAILTKDEVKG